MSIQCHAYSISDEELLCNKFLFGHKMSLSVHTRLLFVKYKCLFVNMVSCMCITTQFCCFPLSLSFLSLASLLHASLFSPLFLFISSLFPHNYMQDVEVPDLEHVSLYVNALDQLCHFMHLFKHPFHSTLDIGPAYVASKATEILMDACSEKVHCVTKALQLGNPICFYYYTFTALML